MGIEFIFWLLAAIAFGLAAFQIQFPKTKPVAWQMIAYMFITLAIMVHLT